MSKQYHILNGDSLKEQFPKDILGQTIVTRECLVDGNIKGISQEEFFRNRAVFISETHGCKMEDYYKITVSQFEQMKEIPQDSEINLWFEDDLFCQVNFWFVMSLLSKIKHKRNYKYYLVRPSSGHEYSFGSMNQKELSFAYKEKIALTDLNKIEQLWNLYQNEDSDAMLSIAQDLQVSYPFILSAIEAHIQRLPSKNSFGRPIDTLISILQELRTDNFGTIFREFLKREPIYGFGDLQVQNMIKYIKTNSLVK